MAIIHQLVGTRTIYDQLNFGKYFQRQYYFEIYKQNNENEQVKRVIIPVFPSNLPSILHA